MTRQKSPREIGMRYLPTPMQSEALQVASEAYKNLIDARYAYKRAINAAMVANCSQKEIADAVGVRTSTLSKHLRSGIQENGVRPEHWRDWNVEKA